MNYTAIQPDSFFSLIWPVKLLTDESLELRAVLREGDSSTIVHRGFYSSIKEFWKACEKEARTRPSDLYFGVATRYRQGGKKIDCYRSRVVWVDLDGQKFEERLKGLEDLPPDLMVDSGGGLHLYWQLEAPILLRVDERWRTIEGINRALCKKLLGDTASLDISRILRVPGFFNHKYNPPREVKAYQKEELNAI